jgi:hypothetical protein
MHNRTWRRSPRLRSLLGRSPRLPGTAPQTYQRALRVFAATDDGPGRRGLEIDEMRVYLD